MDDLLQEFLVESHENLDQLDQDLVTLEADPGSPEILSRVFRTIHTLKGSCGFLGFTKLEEVAHVGENLLSRLRDGDLQVDAEVATALLSLVDAVRDMLAKIEGSGQEGDTDYSGLIQTLTRLQQGGASAAGAAGTEKASAATAEERESKGITVVTKVVEAEEAAGQKASIEIAAPVEKFLIESYESLDRVDQELAAFEKTGSSDALSPALGLLGMLDSLQEKCRSHGFEKLESVTSAGVSLVGRLGGGTVAPSPEVTAALLSLIDVMRQMLASIETTGTEGDADPARLIAALSRLQESGTEPAAATSDASQAAQDGDEKPSPTGAGPSVSETSIRVDVGLLDALMDGVGELVLARNRIMQFKMNQEDRTVLAAYQRLDLITAELQESVIRTRMQPIRTIWGKFPRVVRDLARECGKKVNLKMEGQETELDRTLIEAIKDPLTHLVRNAVDHGIETPEARRRAGKSETGTLFLRAFHEGGQVNIEISDDGGGIDPQRVMKKAIDRHLLTAEEAGRMNEREILNLIFTPGFSTAEKVTNVSGRGVGMDVVKSNMEKINGSIDIQSQVGVSTTIKVKIPLTLAIIPALMVRCAGEPYAIPQASLLELVRLEAEDVDKKIEMFHGAPVYRLRGNLLPLVYLDRELKLEDETSRSRQDGDSVNIVVLQADERQFGLVVDGVRDTEEIVVKPLGQQVRAVPVFAGATILGDGKVALILDVLGLAQRAHVVSDRKETLPVEEEAKAATDSGEYQVLLLLESASGTRLALPLSQVTRLEKIQGERVEKAGQRRVVQYRGEVMPLIDVSASLGMTIEGEPSTGDADETLQVVVVHNNEGRHVGLVFRRILDIVEDRFTTEDLGSREGVTGTFVVQGQVAELLDLNRVIQIADPKLFEQFGAAEMAG